MRNVRERLVSALAGVFGLPLDERALWPDIILSACLGFALLFVVGSLATLAFDFAFFVSSLAALLLIFLAKRKKAVLGTGFVFVGLRCLIAVILGFQWKSTLLVLICFGLGGLLLWGSRNESATDGAPSS